MPSLQARAKIHDATHVLRLCLACPTSCLTCLIFLIAGRLGEQREHSVRSARAIAAPQRAKLGHHGEGHCAVMLPCDGHAWVLAGQSSHRNPYFAIQVASTRTCQTTQAYGKRHPCLCGSQLLLRMAAQFPGTGWPVRD